MSVRIQAACRRCGGGPLTAEVAAAWGVFEGGALVKIDLAPPIEVKGRWAICQGCGEAQPIERAEETADG